MKVTQNLAMNQLFPILFLLHADMMPSFMFGSLEE